MFACDGTPRALAPTLKVGEREVALIMLARVRRTKHAVVIDDKGYAGTGFQADAAALDATIVRPRRNDEGGRSPRLAPIRQRMSRSSGPPKTSSPSNATARAACTHCERA